MQVSLSDLNQFDIIRSVFTLIFIIITIIVGIKIILNYRQKKNKVFITVGLALIFLSGGYWANGFSFLTIAIYGYAFDPPLYILFLNLFTPIGAICWIYSMEKLVFPKKGKLFAMLVYLSSLAYIGFVVLAISIDYRILGSRVPGTVFDYSRTLIPLIYTFSAGIIEAITGLMFAYKSLIADSPLVKWKGRFFLLSMLFLISGVLLDGVFVGEYLLLKVIIRLFLVASSILYYFGFFLPKKFSNRLSQE